MAELASAPAESRRFIGRLSERRQLAGALERAASGSGQMVLITGEPGIGKTTLLDAFVHELEASGSAWHAYGRCSAHAGEREPYMPVLEAFGRLGRSADASRVVAALRKFAPTWAIQLQGLLNAEDAALARQQATGAMLGRMLREMGDLIEELGRSKPFVLSIEDLHWSDRATLDLLEYLAKRRSNMRALIVATARSWECEAAEELAEPESLFTSASASAWDELALTPFSLEEVGQLIGAWFDAPEWTDVVAARLHDRTGGNPLFLNSVLNHQVRTGSFQHIANGWSWQENAQAWRVPNELRGFIQHWFAQRSGMERRLLGVASVSGKDFEEQLLADVLDVQVGEIQALCELLRVRGFFELSKDRESCEAGAAAGPAEVYRFAHPLIQQVLHDALPREQRVAYHLKIARCLPRSVHPARLAHHLEQGGAPQEAIEHHLRAGESAHSRYAYHDAVLHFDRALLLLRRAPESAERDALELRILLASGQPLVNMHGWTAASVETAYRRAYELCRDVHGAQHFASLAGLYKFFLARGHFETAGEIAERCHACAVELGYRPLVMTGHATLGFVYYFRSELALARGELETSRALYDAAECQSFAQIFGDDPGVGCLGFLARVEFLEGNALAARELGREALALARRLSHPHVIATALALNAHIEAWGEHDSAVAEIAEELAAVSRSQSFALWTVIAKFFSAWVRCRAGHHNALSEMCGAFAQYDAVGAVADRATYASLLAEQLLNMGCYDACLEVVSVALTTPPRLRIWDARLEGIREACKAISTQEL
ncbi:MAG: ATP-binding protein [Myxococcota bacterium]